MGSKRSMECFDQRSGRCHCVLCHFGVLYPLSLCLRQTVRNPRIFIRRSVRIVLPMAAAIVLARIAGSVDKGSSDLLAGIPAWSLVAELVYYGLYPVLRRIASIHAWSKILGITFVLSLAFALTKPINNVNYSAWGYGGIGSWGYLTG